MNFELDEQQQMLGQSARDFLRAECDKSVVRELEASESGHSPRLWRKMAELGWTGIAIPEEYGGAGWDLLGLAVLFEEVGRAAFDSPLFASTVASLAILEAGSRQQKQEILPSVTAGERILSLAVGEPEVSSDPRFISLSAVGEGERFRLEGSKLFVPYATVADGILVAARTRGRAGDETGITLFLVDAGAPSLRCTPMPSIAPDKQYRLDFDGLEIGGDRVLGPLHGGLPPLQSVLQKATAIRCAEMLGGAEHELAVTAEYTRQRVQFERPIGTFQAVQHRLADMFTDVQASRWTTYQAVCRLAVGRPAARELAIAKAVTSDACQRVAFGAQQLHGGAGVDLDHDLHFYYRRAKAMELSFGAAPVHLEALARDL